MYCSDVPSENLVRWKNEEWTPNEWTRGQRMEKYEEWNSDVDSFLTFKNRTTEGLHFLVILTLLRLAVCSSNSNGWTALENLCDHKKWPKFLRSPLNSRNAKILCQNCSKKTPKEPIFEYFTNDHCVSKYGLWGFIFSGMINIVIKSTFCFLSFSKFRLQGSLGSLFTFSAGLNFNNVVLFQRFSLCKLKNY